MRKITNFNSGFKEIQQSIKFQALKNYLVMVLSKIKNRNPSLAYFVSILFHFFLFLMAYFFTDLQINKINPNAGYVQVFTTKSNAQQINFEKRLNDEKDLVTENLQQDLIKKNLATSGEQLTELLNFLDKNADTTSLEQVYSEQTLNVSIKYPAGWTFLDQNVANELDGVTFWANNTNINPPPYVHLEVCDKSLFNQNRYKHNLPLRDVVIYFNDPENLANYVSQIFYFRTETDQDFSIKLTIKGEESFKAFASTFYGMLKSFRFRSTTF